MLASIQQLRRIVSLVNTISGHYSINESNISTRVVPLIRFSTESDEVRRPLSIRTAGHLVFHDLFQYDYLAMCTGILRDGCCRRDGKVIICGRMERSLAFAVEF